MTVSAQYATEHLLELIDAARRGEEVEIAAGEKPVVKLVVSEPVETALSREQIVAKRQAMFGAGKGKIWLAEDWDSPEVNASIAEDFEDSEIFPPMRSA